MQRIRGPAASAGVLLSAEELVISKDKWDKRWECLGWNWEKLACMTFISMSDVLFPSILFYHISDSRLPVAAFTTKLWNALSTA